MFSNLRRALGLIQVRETGNLISISGIPGDVVQTAMYDIWNTNKLADNVFTHLGNSDASFHKFFAPDVVYMLEKIAYEKRYKGNKRAVKKIINGLYEHTWLKETLIMDRPSIIDLTKLTELNVTMSDYQIKFMQLYADIVPRYLLKGYMLGADPGTGKTLMGLGLALALGADMVICVSPKNAVHRVWQSEIVHRFKKPQVHWNTVDGGDVPHGCKYFIAHFNALDKMISVALHQHAHKVVILLDESHNLNEEDTLQSQRFVELCHVTNCQHVIWSSGTPIKAVGREATPLFRTIDPFFDEDAQKRFRTIFGKTASRANDILRARMGKVHYHVDGSAVLEWTTVYKEVSVRMRNGQDYTLKAIALDMAKFVKDRVEHYRSNMRNYVRMYEDALDVFEKTLHTREQHKDYDTYRRYIKTIRKGFDPRNMQVESKFVNHYEKKVIIPALPTKELRDNFKDVRSVVKYYLLKVQGEALGRVLGQARANVHIDMINHGQWFLHQDGKEVPITIEEIIDYAEKKTLIFSSFNPVVDAMAAYVKNKGYKPLIVYGETNSQLPAIVNKFEKDEDANPCVATYLSLSTAVPLTMANNIISLNAPYREYQYKQMVARSNRRGQDTQPYVWNVKLDTGEEPNISTRSHDILEWSRRQVSEILGKDLPEGMVEGVAHEEYSTIYEPLVPLGQKDIPSHSEMDRMNWEDLPVYFTTPMDDSFTLEDFADMMDYEDTWERQHRPTPDIPYRESWTNW